MNDHRESIFRSVIRAFFKSFAVVAGIALAISALIIGLGSASQSISVPDKSQLTITPDADWNQKLLPQTTPVFLRLDVEGVIGTGNLRGEKFKKMLVDSRTGAIEGDRIKGILLYINSPGGVVTDIDIIYSALKEYKEKYQIPIVAFIQGMCASGGMYIACAADQVLATTESIVGSVGVRIGPAFNVSDVMQKIGIQSLTLTEGKGKDTLNPFRPWTPTEGQSIQAILAADYEVFVNIVTASRKRMSREKLVGEYGAHVFAAPRAEEYGYIDASNATYGGALKALAKAAQIGEGESYQVVRIEPYQSFVKELTENCSHFFSRKVNHVFPTGTYTTSEMSGQFLYLYEP